MGARAGLKSQRDQATPKRRGGCEACYIRTRALSRIEQADVRRFGTVSRSPRATALSRVMLPIRGFHEVRQI